MLVFRSESNFNQTKFELNLRSFHSRNFCQKWRGRALGKLSTSPCSRCTILKKMKLWKPAPWKPCTAKRWQCSSMVPTKRTTTSLASFLPVFPVLGSNLVRAARWWQRAHLAVAQFASTAARPASPVSKTSVETAPFLTRFVVLCVWAAGINHWTFCRRFQKNSIHNLKCRIHQKCLHRAHHLVIIYCRTEPLFIVLRNLSSSVNSSCELNKSILTYQTF